MKNLGGIIDPPLFIAYRKARKVYTFGAFFIECIYFSENKMFETGAEKGIRKNTKNSKEE